MKTLAENFGSLHSGASVIVEKLDQKQITASIKLIEMLEKIIGPVKNKMPMTMKAIEQAKGTIRAELSSGFLSSIAGAVTPNIIKPLSKFNTAVEFITALTQGLVQIAQVFTKLTAVSEENETKPIGDVMDRLKLFNQFQKALIPDGVLGFMRGMPMIDSKIIARELLTLSSNDFKTIIVAVENLKKKPEITKTAVETSKEMSDLVDTAKTKSPPKRKRAPATTKEKKTQPKKTKKQTKSSASTPTLADTVKAGGNVETSTNNDIPDDEPVETKISQAEPVLRGFNKKNYSDGLYAYLKSKTDIKPEQIQNFVGNIADILKDVGIKIEESRTLRGTINTGRVLKENLEFSQIKNAAEKAGITDQKDIEILAFRLAKMIQTDRINDESGAMPKTFPRNFKVSKIPGISARDAIGDSNEKRDEEIDAEEQAKSAESQQKLNKPTIMKISVPTVTDVRGHKGTFIPLEVNDPELAGIIEQNRDETKAQLWYINIDKLMEYSKKFMNRATQKSAAQAGENSPESQPQPTKSE